MKITHKIKWFGWETPKRGQFEFFESLCDIFDKYATKIILNRIAIGMLTVTLIAHMIWG